MVGFKARCLFIEEQVRISLLALSSLVARLGQQFAVFVLAHLFSALFYDTAQWITPPL
jgi:hypothetical protein